MQFVDVWFFQKIMEELGAGETLECYKQSFMGPSRGSLEDKTWREMQTAEAGLMRFQREMRTLNFLSLKGIMVFWAWRAGRSLGMLQCGSVAKARRNS